MNKKVSKIVFISIVAALYALLSVVFAPLSFGMVQIRVSETMSLLPMFYPFSILGLTIGCIISNVMGVFMGVNPIGFVDAVFGSIATLIAGYLSYRLRNVRLKGFPLLSVLMPILINGLIVGLELTLVFNQGWGSEYFITMFTYVSLGQVIPCVLSYYLMRKIYRMKIIKL
ncbi:MAG: QueT transporter family protein [Erysipelotrichaceae bacterium]